VRIAPPFLPPYHSDPAARDFQSSIPVEALLQGCHLDVQGLLQQQFLSSPAVQYFGLLPRSSTVVSSSSTVVSSIRSTRSNTTQVINCVLTSYPERAWVRGYLCSGFSHQKIMTTVQSHSLVPSPVY